SGQRSYISSVVIIANRLHRLSILPTVGVNFVKHHESLPAATLDCFGARVDRHVQCSAVRTFVLDCHLTPLVRRFELLVDFPFALAWHLEQLHMSISFISLMCAWSLSIILSNRCPKW